MPHVVEQSRIEHLAEAFEQATPSEILLEAVKQIKNITFACSFGVEDMMIVDLIGQLGLTLPIFYLDTNLLFGETYALIDIVKEKYPHLQFVQVLPKLTLDEQAQQHGDTLWSSRPDQCCALRKVRPLEDHLKGYEGWITGIRRDQSPARANAQTFERDDRFGLTKVNPLVRFTEDEVWQYVRENNVPYNLLHDHGYPSIGCAPCTKAVAPGEDPRSGRWAGFAKTECGLHQDTEE